MNPIHVVDAGPGIDPRTETSEITAQDIIDDLLALAPQLDLQLDGVEISGSSSLEFDLEMDSLNLMDLLVHLERRYDVRIADDRLGAVETIDDVVALLRELRTAGG